MSEYEFWQAVYVASVHSGFSNTCRTKADKALAALRATFGAQAGQSAAPKTESPLSQRDAR